MKRENYLIKSTLILSLGNFLPKFAALITLPIYTGMLTKTQYGRYDLVNIFVYVATILVTIQIHQAAFRFLLDLRGTDKDRIIISNTFIFILIPTILISIVFYFIFPELTFYQKSLLACYMFFSIISNVMGQIARGIGANREYAVNAIINSFLNMILVVILMSCLNLGFTGLFISLNISFLVGMIYIEYKCCIIRKLSFKLYDKKIIIDMLKYSWPMVPNTLSIWVVTTSDKLLVTAILGIEMNAVYAVATKIPNIFTLAYSAFNMAWQESASLSAGDKDNNKYYEKIFEKLFNFLTGSLLLLISFTPILFKFLINGSYEEAYLQIPILYLGVFLSTISSFYGSIYIAKKKTIAVGVSSMIGAIINILINIIFINRYGLYAASISTVISYLILVLYRAYDIEKIDIAHLNYNFKRIIICVILIVFSCMICNMRNFYFNIFNIILAIGATLMLNKNLIYLIKKKINK